MNVTLNLNSWHFKIYSKVVGKTPPKTLCPYFWSLVAITILSPFILMVFLVGRCIDAFFWLKTKLIPKRQIKQKTFEEREKEVADMIKKWEEEERKAKIKTERWNKIEKITLFIAKWTILPLLVIGLIVVIIFAGNTIGWGMFLLKVVIALLMLGTIVTFIWLWDKYSDKIFTPIGKGLIKLNPLKWQVTQLIGGMIYSLYVKACPMIKWEGEVTEENYSINE